MLVCFKERKRKKKCTKTQAKGVWCLILPVTQAFTHINCVELRDEN